MARPLCLLLFDDDPARQSIVRSALRRRADLMLVANTASETWRILERGIPIDRVLIDLTSPHDGRMAIAEEIQARYPGIKIVISTETPDAVGAFPVLQKPYAPLELWAALAQTVT